MAASPLLIVSLAVGAASAASIVFALRGRRIDDHPLCRRCRYDLSNLPESSTRCPECGADLAAGRAIRIGHRHPRRAVAAAASPFLSLPLVLAALLSYGRAR